jgi:catechol 2,3-dioxygenase-like lactoylglutathione lyase family enzyme
MSHPKDKESGMFATGNVTVIVSNMDAAVRFYTEVLGLKLQYRFAGHWASVEVGKGITIGLHPASEHATPGRKGSMSIGLEVTGSIHEAVRALEAKGVKFDGAVNEGKAGSFIAFADPDGNPLYLAQLNWSHVHQGEGQYQHA